MQETLQSYYDQEQTLKNSLTCIQEQIQSQCDSLQKQTQKKLRLEKVWKKTQTIARLPKANGIN